MRRHRLAATLLCGLLAGCASYGPPAPVAGVRADVNERLRDIAADLGTNPFVGKVTLCVTPGAVRAVIHVRWMHYVPPAVLGGEAELRKHASAINLVQHDAYWITRAILTHGPVDIRAEGREWTNPIDDVGKEYYHRLDTLEKAQWFVPAQLPVQGETPEEIVAALAAPQKNQTYADTSRELRSRYPGEAPGWSAYGYAPGADLLLQMVDNVVVLPAQTPNAERLAEAVRKNHQPNNKSYLNDPAVTDGREDAALSLAAQRDSSAITTILYGTVHAFGGTQSCGEHYAENRMISSHRDNITTWNDKHPDNTFSLLEITPLTFSGLEQDWVRAIAREQAPAAKTPPHPDSRGPGPH